MIIIQSALKLNNFGKKYKSYVKALVQNIEKEESINQQPKNINK